MKITFLAESLWLFARHAGHPVGFDKRRLNSNDCAGACPRLPLAGFRTIAAVLSLDRFKRNVSLQLAQGNSHIHRVLHQRGESGIGNAGGVSCPIPSGGGECAAFSLPTFIDQRIPAHFQLILDLTIFVRRFA